MSAPTFDLIVIGDGPTGAADRGAGRSGGAGRPGGVPARQGLRRRADFVAAAEEVASDGEQVLNNGDWFRVVTFWTVRHDRIVERTQFRTGPRATRPPGR